MPLNLALMDRSRSPDAAYREFAEEHGEVGGRTRGIRGGRRARARREAYIGHVAETTGVDPFCVPVIRPGGRARPLLTTRFWLPEDSDPSEAAEEEEEEPQREVVNLTQYIDWSQRLAPRPRVVVPKATGPKAHFSRRVHLDSGVSHGGGGSGVSHGGSSGSGVSRGGGTSTELVAFGGSRRTVRAEAVPEPVSGPRVPVSDQRVNLPQGARVYFNRNGNFVEVRHFNRLTCPLICVDFHQVIDTFRVSNRYKFYPDENGVVDHRVSQALTELRDIARVGECVVVVLSYLSSEDHRLNLLHVARASQFPVEAIVTTSQPTGPQGKLSVAKALTRSNETILFDDGPHIVSEWLENHRPAIQILVPGKPLAAVRGVRTFTARNILDAVRFARLFSGNLSR